MGAAGCVSHVPGQGNGRAMVAAPAWVTPGVAWAEDAAMPSAGKTEDTEGACSGLCLRRGSAPRALQVLPGSRQADEINPFNVSSPRVCRSPKFPPATLLLNKAKPQSPSA